MNPRSSFSTLPSLRPLLVAACALAGLSASSLWADTVVIQAGLNPTPCPTGSYSDGSGGSTAGGFTGTSSTTYKITASLTPAVYACGAYSGVRYNAGGGTVGTTPYMNLTPTLAPGGTAANFKPGANANTAIYLVRGARVSDASGGANTYKISYTGCSGPAASGAGATSFFASGGSGGLNQWNTITTIALNTGVTAPTVKFVSSALSGTTRTYADSFCFIQQFSPSVTSLGSLNTSSTSVTVGGCNASAAGIYLYDSSASWTQVGANTSPGGASSVTISGLNLSSLVGHVIYASQDITVALNGTTYHCLGDSSTLTAANSVTVTSGVDPCTTVAVVGGINNSPLAPAGVVYSDATTITCTGCSGSATAVKLKDTSNGNAVVGTGTGGLSTVAVSVGALTTGHILCAVQTVGGVDSCVAGAPNVTVGNSGCTYVAAVGGIATVNPITAGDTSVDVTGVSASAQDVTVYANGVQVGQNSAPAGQTTVTVTTSALVKGQYLTASQKLSGTEGCIPGSTGAPIIGGGNAALTVCLELTVGSTPYLWMGANGRSGGYASSPTGATVVTPGAGWQTVSWTPATASGYNWGTAAAYTWPSSGSASLQYIWLCPNNNSEMGPYTVYIDTVQNGTTSLYNWEGDFPGLSAFMQNPSFATTGRTPVHVNPDLTACVNTNADMGAECQRMDWEFVNTASANSIRGVLKNAITVDLSKSISFRILVLPAGSSAPALTLSQPGAKTLTAGTADSLNITATDHSGGTSTMAYLWKKNGVAITSANAGDRTGYTTATLAFGAPVAGDAGSYSCAVTDTVTGVNAGTYTGECAQFAVTVNKGTPTIAWANPADITYGTALSGTQLDATASVPGSFAYTPASGTVLGAGSSQALSATFTPTDTASYNGASATVHINVNSAATSAILTSSKNPANPGDNFTLTATVSSAAATPTGSVQFKIDGSNADGPVSLLSGVASYGPTTLGLGSHAIQAVYTDSANFQGSTANLTQLVDTAPTSPNLTASTAKNQPLVLSFGKLVAKASDADAGDTLSVTGSDTTSAHGPANNVVRNSGAGTITYTPATDYTGSDSFTYTISDSYGRTAVGTVSVTVTDNGGGSPNVVGSATFDSGTGTFSVTFAGIPGVEYTVEYAEGSAAPPWTKLENVTAGDKGLFVVEDTAPQSPGRYYRTVYPSY